MAGNALWAMMRCSAFPAGRQHDHGLRPRKWCRTQDALWRISGDPA